MSEEKAGRAEFDPFGPWMQFTDKWMKSWSNVLSETVASDTFATAMGKQLESMIEASRLFQQQMRLSTEQYLQAMNVATRAQVTGVAERMTNIELRLDDLEAKLDEALDQLRRLNERLDKPES